MISEALTGLEPFTSVKAACALLGKPRATLYRQRNPPRPRERPPGPRPAHPAALSASEQEQLLGVLNAERFADKSPAQAWAVLLDEGIYLASISTMYRVLRAADQVRERRAQACGARIYDRGGDLLLLVGAWGCHAAIWYSCVSPLRSCFRRIRCRRG